MTSIQKLEQLNDRLRREYGLFQGRLEANWKMVWSENEFEKRVGEFEDRTPEGYLIRRVTECREVPKYKYVAPNSYILEKAMVTHNQELALKFSYEPVYTFENPFNYPPSWEAIKFIVELVYEQAAKAVGMKYKEPSKEEEAEAYKKRIDGIVEELYGDRTDVSDALAYREGIIVPANYGVK